MKNPSANTEGVETEVKMDDFVEVGIYGKEKRELFPNCPQKNIGCMPVWMQ